MAQNRTLLLTLLTQVLSARGEDWVSHPPFSHVSDDYQEDSYTTAYLNVTKFDENGGWSWDKTEVGRYGGGFVGPASGLIIHVSSALDPNDHSGCEMPLMSSRDDRRLPPPGEPWIALIRRGKCNFEVKVENAYKSNAAGVLVYNDRDSSTLDKMKLAQDSGRNICAVFTYKWKGEELATLTEKSRGVLVHITVASKTTSRAANINRTSILFVSVTFIILMIISLAWLVFYYVQRFRYIHAKDRLSRKLGSAAKKALDKIPTKNIKREDKEVQGEGECCAVCIERYKHNDTLRILPCSHEFHRDCIDPWLLEHRTCPMCKMDILQHYGFVFTGSQESIFQVHAEEIASLDSDNPDILVGEISPLPEIRAVAILNHNQMDFSDFSPGGNTSRASSPNEMAPPLNQDSYMPIRISSWSSSSSRSSTRKSSAASIHHPFDNGEF
ncbi:protein goliath-like [Harmonia axyridis]|uniref:protein goliath-like n=1 Tax=Harmonia axyridis TaxID=115357 RepID=UPI001E278EF7|nr:protein goliath-like [Harmonia axyridis]